MEAGGHDPSYWLAQTKLRPPPLRSDLIDRHRLPGLVRCALLSSRLTLVSAPARYGRITLLGALPTVVLDLPLAWLSLDEGDGAPARFILALVLDDLHLISEPQEDLALDYVLERMSPRLHVAVATRDDSALALARLRATGHLAKLLNDRLHLGLSRKELERLHQLLEG